MLKAKLNNKSFDVDFENGKPILNGSPLSWDFTRINDTTFHIIHNNKSYSAELIQLDKATKTIKLKINGGIHTVELKDRYDLLLEKMGINGAAAGKLNSVKAPMPGLIVKINVAAGDVVKQSDALLVLEAMKMENMIKASADATVSQVKVKKGDSVEKGQVLIEFNK
jgi:acetyl/propionyl-CoA carboxylase alpha subunit